MTRIYKRGIAICLCLSMLAGCGSTKVESISLEKSQYSNPIAQKDEQGDYIYGGDPSILVSGDTVYLYTGHDASTKDEVKKKIYNIPEYYCYSTTDLVNWKAEGVVMTMDTVSWAKDAQSAWAAQVMEHKDKETGSNKYYLYYCSWDKTGKQAIGVAVSDSPTGQFVDIGKPLVKSTQTSPSTSSFNDIDPTAWIETDENGEEHRYLAWGNGAFYVCELNEDMISIKDTDNDGKINNNKKSDNPDIKSRLKGLDSYTEAPWLYRRQDENGNYYGDYYLFFAHQWRECMAYARTDDLLSGNWTDTKMIMQPTTTSNTNHMAVFDFKGKTYFVYHNGSNPAGNGYKRSACIRELSFDENGDVEFMEETTAGLAGEAVKLTLSTGEVLGHEGFVNDITDSSYPYQDVAVGPGLGSSDKDMLWVLCPGKSDDKDETLLSIQSENKSGLYLTVNKSEELVLSADSSGSEEMALRQTFRTVAFDADSDEYMLESLYKPGFYVASQDGKLLLTDKPKEAAVFVK